MLSLTHQWLLDLESRRRRKAGSHLNVLISQLVDEDGDGIEAVVVGRV